LKIYTLPLNISNKNKLGVEMDLKKSRRMSIRKIRAINLQELINRMTDYFVVLDLISETVEKSAVLRAVDIVNQWIKAGRIDKYGNLKACANV
jgi:hypothetical protein